MSLRTSQLLAQDVLLTRAGQGSVERTNPKEKMPIGYSIASISVAPTLSSIVGTVVQYRIPGLFASMLGALTSKV